MHAIAGGSGRPTSATRAGLVAALLLICAVSAVAWPAGVQAASVRYLNPVFSSVSRDANLQYGTAVKSDGTRQKLYLDLYRPVGDTKSNRPVVIFVHGGDYRVPKDVWRNRILVEMFARRGYVAASMQYRSGVDGTSREAAWDMRAAVRWFKKNAGSLRVSPNRIVVMGTSAGASAALHVAFNPDDACNSGNPAYSSNVAAGMSLSGIGDVSEINPGDPPIAMVVAEDDHPFWEGTLATCNATRAVGNVCDLHEYSEGGHPPPFFLEYRAQIIDQFSWFICKRVLGPTICPSV